MENNLVNAAVSIALAIVGVAIIAVLVSQKANTTGVINAGGSAFSGSLATALGPVTGYTPQSGNGLGFGGASEITYE